jgi:hypothetical protein
MLPGASCRPHSDGHTTIVVGTGKAVAGGVSRRQQARAQPAAAPPAITEEEFAAQKARILEA